MRWAEDAVARARREAFPKPIVTIRMSQRQYDLAVLDANDVELGDLMAGLQSGQIVIGEPADG
jgi:hypothetical protein